jgi:hypothetical protein
MATILDSIGTFIHDAAQALIDNQIPTKMANMSTSYLNAGFGIVEDSLKVLRDITAAEPPSPPQP